MQVDLWVAVLRILAAVLAISLLWPNLLQPWRWMRQAWLGKGQSAKTLQSGDTAS